jgi:4,5-dihydroxyphthalate decarboxylase
MDALRTGAVRPEGVDLDYISIESPREIFDRMAQKREFDMSELSSSEFVVMHCNGGSPFVALPVFPSKVFRHSYMFGRVKSGVTKPKDLEGKRVGVPLYTMTAAVWMRGLLEEDFGVDLSTISWVQGGLDHGGTHGVEREPPKIPGVRLATNTSSRSLNDMLEAGEIDAFIGTNTPACFKTGVVTRLLPDFHEREKDYVRRTGIHPIMHLVAMKREVYEKNPGIARPLYRAFEDAKNRAWSKLTHSGAHVSMLPFIYHNVMEVRDTMGEDPWPYGVEGNRRTLEALVRFMHNQKLIPYAPKIEDLFVKV